MQQPERMYYPLVKAAHMLGCEVDYLIHLAANGLSEICIKYTMASEEKYTWHGMLNHGEVKELYEKDKKDDDSIVTIKTAYQSKLLSVVLYICCEVIDTGEVKSWPYEYEYLSGILKIPTDVVYELEMDFIQGKSVRLNSLCLPSSELPYKAPCLDLSETWLAENGLSFEWFNPFEVSPDDLIITHEELLRLRSKGFPTFSEITGRAVGAVSVRDPFDNPKTQSNVVALTRTLFALIPNFSNVDIDDISDEKLKELLQAEANSKNIDMPDIHFQTLAKYFGGSRPQRKKST